MRRNVGLFAAGLAAYAMWTLAAPASAETFGVGLGDAIIAGLATVEGFFAAASRPDTLPTLHPAAVIALLLAFAWLFVRVLPPERAGVLGVVLFVAGLLGIAAFGVG